MENILFCDEKQCVPYIWGGQADGRALEWYGGEGVLLVHYLQHVTGFFYSAIRVNMAWKQQTKYNICIYLNL